eukprot:352473-Chlamydomonas_euryale.AAC.15
MKSRWFAMLPDAPVTATCGRRRVSLEKWDHFHEACFQLRVSAGSLRKAGRVGKMSYAPTGQCD